uniref:Uncharacterized protein n=1 Tax=Leptobrachium leishanense TaxID=445787 RepID=A0A8C5Q2Q4_9ANUR
MASAADLTGELTCCICLNIYTDPVTMPCGHSFCQLCIGEALAMQGIRYSCPECRDRYKRRPKLKRNWRLSNIAESFQSAHQVKKKFGAHCTYCIQSPVPAAKTCLRCEASLCENHLRVHSRTEEHVLIEPTTSLGKRKCSVHKEILKYYCCEDQTCICVSCSLAGEHRGHQMLTLNEAFQRTKEKLRNIQDKLTPEREETEKRVQKLFEFMRLVEDKTVRLDKKREFCKVIGILHQVFFLIRQLKIKKEDLSRKVGLIEKLCNMMDPVTVLESIASCRAAYCDAKKGNHEVTERHDMKVQDVGDLDLVLISVTLHSGLVGIGTGELSRYCVPKASDMLLDINTAGYNTSVSGDLKCVSWTGNRQTHSQIPGRFLVYPQVLSSTSFSSGRHYWEVERSDSGWWGVGMAYPSIEKGGDQSVIGDNNKSWSLWYKSHYYVKHDSKLTKLQPSSHYKKFGIFLDYEAGSLSFYELSEPIRHLHTFTAAFTEPLHAVFGVYRSKTSLSII